MQMRYPSDLTIFYDVIEDRLLVVSRLKTSIIAAIRFFNCRTSFTRCVFTQFLTVIPYRAISSDSRRRYFVQIMLTEHFAVRECPDYQGFSPHFQGPSR
jgi:hypothetical protein